MLALDDLDLLHLLMDTEESPSIWKRWPPAYLIGLRSPLLASSIWIVPFLAVAAAESEAVAITSWNTRHVRVLRS